MNGLVTLLATVGMVESPLSLADQVVISVGHNLGLADEEPLRFAERDAERMVAVFSNLGNTASERVYTLLAPTAVQVERAFSEAREQVAKLTQSGRPATLVFYYAGHGDQESLHLGATKLTLTRLFAFIDSVPATLRLAIIDSCRTSGNIRRRGVQVAPAFDIHAGRKTPRGTVVITSASPGEPAQESARLGGAIFTHYLQSGLRGAADRDADQQITVDEAYAFAYARTLSRTVGSLGTVQRPSFDVDLAGAGPVVLTQPRRATAVLVFPADADATYYVFSLPGGNAVAEMPARAQESTRLAVPSGRLLVHRRAPNGSGSLEVDLPWGGERAIDIAQLTEHEGQRLVLRGRALSLRNWSAGVALLSEVIATAPGSQDALRWGMGATATLGHSWHGWSLEGELSWSRSDLELLSHQGSEHRLGLQAAANLQLVVGAWYRVWMGVGANMDVAIQELIRRDRERLEKAGFSAREVRWGPGAGLVATLAAALSLAGHTALFIKLSGYGNWTSTHDNGTGLSNMRLQPRARLEAGGCFSF